MKRAASAKMAAKRRRRALRLLIPPLSQTCWGVFVVVGEAGFEPAVYLTWRLYRPLPSSLGALSHNLVAPLGFEPRLNRF